MNLDNILKGLRDSCGFNTEETPETTNVKLTNKELKEKIRQEENGEELLILFLSGEWRICLRLNLISPVEGWNKNLPKRHEENQRSTATVPRWNAFIAHLKIVNSVGKE